ncbi:metallophosphoesterase [Propionicicella superfundia]|uniref:metallophosphoesterase n=1 Tax=Propionicicella superfundia TaxID=348582 RepID=UPI0003FCEA9E|nr:metallophosphoesterase [Propionicicella superfundia]
MKTPDLVIAHLSDPHLATPGHPDAERTRTRLALALAAVAGREQPPAAVVITGDLTQDGDEASYADLRDLVHPAAAAMGAQVLCVPGNHDRREAYAEVLLGRRSSEPVLQVLDVAGLRVIGLDSSVPGRHHGALDPDHLDALRAELATPARRGTVLALHHPPLPPVLDFMQDFILMTRDELASAIAGSDVRAILTGHLHHPYFATFAGVPVATASSISRPVDLTRPSAEVVDRDGPALYNHVAVYPDAITHAVVAIGEWERLPSHRDL